MGSNRNPFNAALQPHCLVLQNLRFLGMLTIYFLSVWVRTSCHRCQLILKTRHYVCGLKILWYRKYKRKRPEMPKQFTLFPCVLDRKIWTLQIISENTELQITVESLERCFGTFRAANFLAGTTWGVCSQILQKCSCQCSSSTETFRCPFVATLAFLSTFLTEHK